MSRRARRGEDPRASWRGFGNGIAWLLLRLARRRLPNGHRDELYAEWAAELQIALHHSEGTYLSRLMLGIRYAAGLLITAPQIARDLGRVRSSDINTITADPWLDQLLGLQDRRRALLRRASEFRQRHLEWCFDWDAFCREPHNLDEDGANLLRR